MAQQGLYLSQKQVQTMVLAPQLQLVGLALSTSLTAALVSLVSWALLRAPGESPPRVPRDGLAVLAASSLAAAVTLPMRITELADVRLWAAAVPMVLLLALGGWLARRAP